MISNEKQLTGVLMISMITEEVCKVLQKFNYIKQGWEN